jgi:SAM-dependent methyltransferase
MGKKAAAYRPASAQPYSRQGHAEKVLICVHLRPSAVGCFVAMIRNFGCRRLVLRVSIPANLTTQRKTEAAPRDVPRPCPACGGSDFTPHWLKGELRIVRCRACEMVFANPSPAGMASGKFYDTEGTAYYLSPAKLESDYADVRFERELRLFRKFCPRGAVLDVGCSSGAFLFQLHKRWPGDYQILGTDVSGAPLDYAESRGVPVARGNFLELDFDGRTKPTPDPSPEGSVARSIVPLPGAVRGGFGSKGKFDAVTFWAVIEHLEEPNRFLQHAGDALKPFSFRILNPSRFACSERAIVTSIHSI